MARPPIQGSPIQAVARRGRRWAREWRARARTANTLRRLRRRGGRAPERGPAVTVLVDATAGSHDARHLAARLTRHAGYRDHVVRFGAGPVTTDLILLAAPGTDPVGSRWLATLVGILDDEQWVAAAPATLRRGGGGIEGNLGLRPGWFRGVPGGVPIPLADPTTPPRGPREAWAVDGGCLLVRRTAYEAADGRDPELVTAWWDVDLCLRLRELGGRIAVTDEAFVLRDDDPRSDARADPERARFAARWSASAGQEARAGFAGLDQRSTALVGTDPLGLPEPLRRHRIDQQPSADLVIVTDPTYQRAARTAATVKVAVTDDPAAWPEGFDAYDVVVTGEPASPDLEHRIAPQPVDRSAGVAAVLGAARRAALAPRLAWRIGSPAGPEAERWGDTHLARHLAAALRPLGFASTITPHPFWDHPAHQAVDVAIHVHGLVDYRPQPAHVNVLWVISHPERVSAEMAGRFDLVLVASEVFADRLATLTHVPVIPFLQATNTHLFRPLGLERDIPVLFVGNSRRRERPIVAWALEAGLPLTVYGGDWEGIIPDEIVAERFVPNHRLPQLYNRAQVVLNDHWPDMAEQGFVSNRIFDVAATGTPVVTDGVNGLSAVVGDAIPVAEDAASLERAVRDLQANRDGRAPATAATRRMVVSRHSMIARAYQFVDALRAIPSQRVEQIIARSEMTARNGEVEAG